MMDRPILFSGPMVRALLNGSKTQTRRVVRNQFANDATPAEVAATSPEGWQISGHSGLWWDDAGACIDDAIRCPYGQPGDRLWVKETHLAWWSVNPDDPTGQRVFSHVAAFAADGYELEPGERWIPSIHMRRVASRIALEIIGVRVERLQDISEADAIAEGCTKNHNGYYWGGPHPEHGLKQMATAVGVYRDLWQSINGIGSWDANPWVWVVEFKLVKP